MFPGSQLTAGYEVCFMAQTSPKGALYVCPNRKINLAGALTDIQHETKTNIPHQDQDQPLLSPPCPRPHFTQSGWLYDHWPVSSAF